MKSLIVCASKSHGNTRRVADRMAEVLDAEVVSPSRSIPQRFASTTSSASDPAFIT